MANLFSATGPSPLGSVPISLSHLTQSHFPVISPTRPKSSPSPSSLPPFSSEPDSHRSSELDLQLPLPTPAHHPYNCHHLSEPDRVKLLTPACRPCTTAALPYSHRTLPFPCRTLSLLRAPLRLLHHPAAPPLLDGHRTHLPTRPCRHTAQPPPRSEAQLSWKFPQIRPIFLIQDMMNEYEKEKSHICGQIRKKLESLGLHQLAKSLHKSFSLEKNGNGKKRKCIDSQGCWSLNEERNDNDDEWLESGRNTQSNASKVPRHSTRLSTKQAIVLEPSTPQVAGSNLLVVFSSLVLNAEELSTTSKQKNATIGKGKRGPTVMPHVAQRKPKDAKEIKVNEKGQIVGDNSDEIISYIGCSVRDGSIIPCCLHDWRYATTHMNDRLLAFIRKKEREKEGLGPPRRDELFVISQTNKKGDVPNPIAREIIVEMDKRSSKIRAQGSQFPAIGENDILGQVMGKKHYSQMRCVGFGVRKNDMFRASSSILRLEENDKTLEKLKTKLEGEIEKKMEKKMRRKIRRKMHAMLESILSGVTEKGHEINHDENSMESENTSEDEGGSDEEDEGKDEKDDKGRDEDDH